MTDDKNNMTMLSVFTARGILVESQTATWLYGTASEHAVLFQYNFNNARSVFAGMLQTESPYFQPSPHAPAPFNVQKSHFNGDPEYSCQTGGPNGTDFDGCDSSWGVIVQQSQDIYIASAGVYSWFHTYSEDCSTLLSRRVVVAVVGSGRC